MKKYLDVPLIEFLQKIVDDNVESYREDFDLDKEIFAEVAVGGRLSGNVWLWMTRQHGTQCMSEQEVFVKDSPAYSTWCYFDNDFVGEKIKAYAVEVSGVKEGVVYGNVYELDYKAHVAEVQRSAVQALEVHKVFEDGYVDRVAPEGSCYGYYSRLVEEPGHIVDSRWAPVDEAELSHVLSRQKNARDKLRVGKYQSAVVDLIANAAERSGGLTATAGEKELEL